MWSAMTRRDWLLRSVVPTISYFLDQRLEDVDFVVGVHTLHDGGDTLQTHAGIHGRTGQRLHGAVSLTVELHEHHVPDLDETVAILFR